LTGGGQALVGADRMPRPWRRRERPPPRSHRRVGIGPVDARLPNPRRYLGWPWRDAGERPFTVTCEQPRFSDGTAER